MHGIFILIMLSDLRNCQNDGDVYEFIVIKIYISYSCYIKAEAKHSNVAKERMYHSSLFGSLNAKDSIQ